MEPLTCYKQLPHEYQYDCLDGLVRKPFTAAYELYRECCEAQNVGSEPVVDPSAKPVS